MLGPARKVRRGGRHDSMLSNDAKAAAAVAELPVVLAGLRHLGKDLDIDALLEHTEHQGAGFVLSAQDLEKYTRARHSSPRVRSVGRP